MSINYIKLLFCLVLLASTANAINLFGLNMLNITNGARCMDGSAPGIYLYQPDPNDTTPVNKLMIYFQEIDDIWCAKQDLNKSIQHCGKYVLDPDYAQYGSSNNYTSDLLILIGILQSGDPVFDAYNKVYIKNCDGGSYFSNSTVKYKNTTLNFKGANNVLETLNYLTKIGFIQDRQEVILTGQANGGLAALAWANTVKQYTKGRVRVMPDASMYENDKNDRTKDNNFEKRMASMAKLQNPGGDFPNKKCQAAYPNNIEKCFYASELVKFVDSDIQIFFLQSYYDGWAIRQILGLDCTEQFSSLSQCTQQHRIQIQNYHQKITNNLHQLTQRDNIGGLGVACVGHLFTTGRWDDQNFSVPAQHNNTGINIVGEWLNPKSKLPPQVYLDPLPWPHNVQCARKIVAKPNLLKQ